MDLDDAHLGALGVATSTADELAGQVDAPVEVVTARLDALAHDGRVLRIEQPSHPPRVRYRLAPPTLHA